MYAVVQTGGKQYRVAVGDKIRVESLDAAPGDSISLNEVLLIANDGDVNIGSPLLEGQSVAADVLSQGRGEKIKVFKMKRRQGYRRTQGHRQNYTELQITAIGGAGSASSKPAKKAEPKAQSSDDSSSDKLTKLDGVGPKMEEKLNAAGISTFAKLGSLTAEDIASLADTVNIKEEWVAQAKELS